MDRNSAQHTSKSRGYFMHFGIQFSSHTVETELVESRLGKFETGRIGLSQKGTSVPNGENDLPNTPGRMYPCRVSSTGQT